MPKDSVIIPVYNVEKYLWDCIDSLLVQTMEDIECVFVDDVSTDAFLNVLEKNYQKRPEKTHVIKRLENRLLGATRILVICDIEIHRSAKFSGLEQCASR